MSPAVRIVVGFALGVALVCANVTLAWAHALSPGFLELSERADGVVDVTWAQSVFVLQGGEMSPRFPVECPQQGDTQTEIDTDRLTQRLTLKCEEGGLVRSTVGVEGLARAYTDVLLRVQLADGSVQQSVLRATASTFTVAAAPSWKDVLKVYARLGVEHILSGLDHLLFVYGLLLLVSGTSALLKTVTAFTVGHSVTLSAAALGFLPLSSGPVELAIALSIFALAVELATEPSAEPGSSGLMRRAPWLVAGSFGLLHGAGFAGALAEIGLPQGDIPLALFSFNLGIEIGQLLFVFVILFLGRLLRSQLQKIRPPFSWAPVYLIGCLSVYWCMERAAALLW